MINKDIHIIGMGSTHTDHTMLDVIMNLKSNGYDVKTVSSIDDIIEKERGITITIDTLPQNYILNTLEDLETTTILSEINKHPFDKFINKKRKHGKY